MPQSKNNLCGFSWCGYPNFLQKFATTRTYIIVYGILGTFQAMGYVYFAITLQTIEKRFKIPSQTTGELNIVTTINITTNYKIILNSFKV